MNLVRSFAEALETREAIVEYNTQQRSRRCADSCLEERPYQERDLQRMQQQQQQQQQLEAYVHFLNQLERLLSQPELEPFHLYVEKQWYRAIDQLVDLEAELYVTQFTARMNTLAQSFSFLHESWIELQNPPHSQNFQQVEWFLQRWRTLWYYSFNFHSPNANEYVVEVLSQLHQAKSQSSRFLSSSAS